MSFENEFQPDFNGKWQSITKLYTLVNNPAKYQKMFKSQAMLLRANRFNFNVFT